MLVAGRAAASSASGASASRVRLADGPRRRPARAEGRERAGATCGLRRAERAKRILAPADGPLARPFWRAMQQAHKTAAPAPAAIGRQPGSAPLAALRATVRLASQLIPTGPCACASVTPAAAAARPSATQSRSLRRAM